MREIHLWVREDGPSETELERAARRARRPGRRRADPPPPRWPPKVLQAGTVPPGPGAVFAVQATSANDARKKLRRWVELDQERQTLETAEARALLERREPLLAQVRQVLPRERS